MEWNLDSESCKVLGKLCKGSKRALEIGSAEGVSTKVLASNCLSVVTIEISLDRLEKAKKNLSEFSNVEFFLGDALEVLKDLEGEFDFVFIDAMKRQYLSYLKLILSKLTPDCVIVADNVISHSEKVQDYLEFVKANFDSETLEVGKGLEVSRKIYK